MDQLLAQKVENYNGKPLNLYLIRTKLEPLEFHIIVNPIFQNYWNMQELNQPLTKLNTILEWDLLDQTQLIPKSIVNQ